jgi:signal transduction histidine kinase
MTRPRHKLLEKQLKEIAPLLSRLPPEHVPLFEAFFENVSSAYFAYEDDRELLENSMELSSKELIETNREMRLQNKEIQTLYKISSILNSPSPLEKTCPDVLQEVVKASGFPTAAIELCGPEIKSFKLMSHCGFKQEELEKRGLEVPAAAAFSRVFLDEESDFFSANIPSAAAGSTFWQLQSAETVVYVPLRTSTRFLGTLALAKPQKAEIPPRFVLWIKAVAAQLAKSIEHNDMDEILQQQRASMAAASKMSALGEMAGGVAHEINNPLAVIKTLSSQLQELAEETPVDQPMVKKMAVQLEKTADRVAKIVNGLRLFSRDGSKDSHQLTSVAELIDDTLALCSERFKSAGTKVLVDTIDPGLRFEVRPTEISQVLLNLLNNAQDAIAGLKEQWIRISVQEKAGDIEIRVIDSGGGIDPQIQSKIFQPFFTTKEIGKGTGLGLSISSGILRGHKGSLTIDPKNGNTCFVIQIPKTQSAESADAA